MNTKTITKVFAAILAFMLSFTNIALLGSYAGNTYAASNLEGQATNVNKAKIEFDAYFNEEGENTHSKTIDIDDEEENLYLSIKVEEGYLINGSISIANANFKVQASDEELDKIQSISTEENKIALNQINRDESVILEVPIKINADSNFNVKDLSKIANITLEGTYVNNKGKESKVSKTIEAELTIDGTAESSLSEDITKYVRYDVNGNKGLILQTSIKSKLVDNKLPIKATKLEIEIPVINNTNPKEIVVSSKSLMASKGERGRTFNEDEYKIEDGKITLVLENNTENLSWIKDVEDEIVITYIYGEEGISDKLDLNLKAKSEITYYGKEVKTAKSELDQVAWLTEKIGDIVTFGYETSEETLYKGYMMAKNGQNTSYVEILSSNIGYRELVDKIVLKQSANYKDEKGNPYLANVLNTYSKISKENLVEILGEDGYIDILSGSGEKITTLNKDNLEYRYEVETSGVIFETSKPIAEGILEIENGREIKSLEYSKEQEETFTSLELKLNGVATNGGATVIDVENQKNIKLENPELQAKFEISNKNLSTVVTNEDVELRVTLKTTGPNTKLYTNPSIEIVLPKQVSNVNIDNAKLVYEKELKISNKQVYKNSAGNTVIKITLSGEQTKYNEELITEGATLVLNADITVDALTPTRNEKIYVNIVNGKDTLKQETDVKIIAPAGIATISQITGYSDEGSIATSISGTLGVGQIKSKAKSREAAIKIMAINNYTEDCKNVVILGRTPFEGNRTITTNKNLGSTFTAKLISEIKSETGLTAEQMTVYYSENAEANYDLTDVKNGWTNDLNFVDVVKSYMIVLNDYTFKTGETLSFSYKIEIPEMLDKEQHTFGVFAVYYQKQEEATYTSGQRKMARAATTVVNTQVAEAAEVGLTTGTGPNLSLTLESDAGDQKVTAGNAIKYTVKVKNNGIQKVSGITVSLPVPERTFYATYDSYFKAYEANVSIKEITLPIDEINAGETKNVEFALKTIRILDAGVPDTELKVSATAKVSGYEDAFTSNEQKNTITYKSIDETEIRMNLTSGMASPLSVGQQIGFSLDLDSSKTVHNVEAITTLPEEFEFIDANNGGVYNRETRVVTWNLSELSSKMLSLNVSVKDLEKDVYKKKVTISFIARCDESEETFESNALSRTIEKPGFSITQTSNKSGDRLGVGEEITYSITVKNLGPRLIAPTIKDILPEELEFVKYTYARQNGETVTVTENDTKAVNVTLALNPSETVTINITAKAKEVNNSNQIVNRVTLTASGFEEIEANTITHSILGTNTDNSTPEENTKHIISGRAWIDENRNGRREDREELLTGIKVHLLNTTTNKIVRTSETNQNGAYIFEDVENGNYVVLFEYDTNQYALTTYQADDVEESNNSDVIKMSIRLNGETKIYAATNTISLSSNRYNIDMGLVNDPKFDLELTKGISLVQVSNSQGVKAYTYDAVKLAKVEIPEKYMNGTAVAITYTFKITNTGAVSGYANKIVDYKPRDLSFSSVLNPEWYEEVDGNLYTTSLSGREIKPGETVEVSLILTKLMTNDNTGLTNNSAELCEVSNDLGLEDRDSKPANKNTEEDDYGVADVIIAVKTGGIIFYSGIVLVLLAIFALGAYEIKKKVLNRI